MQRRDEDGIEAVEIAALVPLEGKRVLEVGCGEGRLTALVAARASWIEAALTRWWSWPVALRLEPGPAVSKSECAVEDEPPRRRVGIEAEVAEALELHGLTDRQLGERRLDQGALEHDFRVRVEVGEGVAVGAWIGAGK